jgi:hypothetical protein
VFPSSIYLQYQATRRGNQAVKPLATQIKDDNIRAQLEKANVPAIT